MKYFSLLIFLLVILPVKAKDFSFPCVVGKSCTPEFELKKYYVELAELDEFVDMESGLEGVQFSTFHSSDFGLIVNITVGRFSTLFLYSQRQLVQSDLNKFGYKLETGLISGVKFRNLNAFIEVYSNVAEEPPYVIEFLNSNGSIKKLD